MYALEKTTIIPDGDYNEILDLPILKLVVIDDNPEITRIANNLAIYPPNIDRHVLWFKESSEDELNEIFNGLDEDYNNIIAFSVSTINKIADYILYDDTIDMVRVDQAFTEAGKPEYNS